MTLTRIANRNIWSIAWPMMLTSMSAPLLGLVDTAMLGHLESARYLAAVAIGANVIALLYWSFGFLRMGTTSLVSQSLGRQLLASQQNIVADRSSETDAVVFRSLIIAAVCGIILALVMPLIVRWVVAFMNASDNIAGLAAEYIRIRLYAAPAVLCTYAIAGWLVGTQRAKGALALVLTSNIINIILDVLFIMGLGLGSHGAALASVIAEYCSLLLGVFIIWRHSKLFNIAHWQHWLKRQAFIQAIAMNGHLLVRTLLLLFALNFFTAQGAAINDNTLAANAILLQLALFSAYVMDGFSYAAEALCGESVGRKNATAFHRYAKICGGWILLTAVVFTAIFSLAGTAIVQWFTNVNPIVEIANQHIIWLVLMPIAGALAYLLDGVFIGAGHTRTMHLAMWLAVVGIFLPIWWLTQSWQNNGLWFAFICFNISRGLSLAYYYPAILKKLNALQIKN